MPKQVAPPRFLRLPEVLQMTGMGKTFIYARQRRDLLKADPTGREVPVWLESSVTEWMEKQIRGP